MKEVSNRTVMTLLIATIVISLGGTFVSLSAINKLTGLGFQQITGFVIVPNATATVSIESFSSIKFSAATVAFGTGSINSSSGATNCTLSTIDTLPNSGCTDSFNKVNNGFTIENDGNTNLTVELRSNVTNVQFIGLNSSLFLWNVTLNESGSCVNISKPRVAIEPNTTADCLGFEAGGACGSIFEDVSNTSKVICPSLLFTDSSDALNIDINISIPDDAPIGSKVAGFIVTGTREPIS